MALFRFFDLWLPVLTGAAAARREARRRGRPVTAAGGRPDEECVRVRIVIAGPPKAGNVWLKCILSHIYDLRPLLNRETPQRPMFQQFKDWVEAGGEVDR